MLYLHMGMPKTGTSSIQRYFTDNAERLSREGIEYPMHLGRRHHALGVEIGKAPQERSAMVSDFLQYLGDRRNNTVVVSSETLTNSLGKPRFPHFADFVRQCERLTAVRLILFIRRFDAFFQSMYLQSVFTGKIGTEFGEYLDARKNWVRNFLAGKAALQQTVQQGNLMVVGYRREVDSVEVIRKLVGIPASAAESAGNGYGPDEAGRGVKAMSFLKNYDLFATRLGLRRPLAWWRREIWRSRFSFKDELLTGYRLYEGARDLEIHLHGLDLSRSLGENDYWNLFKDERPASGRGVVLQPELLNDGDALALRDYEKSFQRSIRSQRAAGSASQA